MKALQITAWHSAPELREVAEPVPGAGEVVIRVAAAGACHSDLHILKDFDGEKTGWTLPFTLGHENTGWVHATGAGVRGIEHGQPVAVYGAWGCGQCRTCQLGMDNYCAYALGRRPRGGGLGRDGGLAEFMLVPDSRFLVPLGDLDPVAAAPLTDAGLTPYHAVKRSLPLLVPGSTTVVIGIGGLGHLAVQVLRAVCATRIVAVDTRPDALSLAQRSGAHHSLAAGDNAAAEIRELSTARGADLVLDFVGSESTLQLAVAVARPLSHITLVGLAGGRYPFGFNTVPYEANLATTYWGSRPDLVELLDLARGGHLDTKIQRFALTDAPSMYELLAAGGITGRAVVVPG